MLLAMERALRILPAASSEPCSAHCSSLRASSLSGNQLSFYFNTSRAPRHRLQTPLVVSSDKHCSGSDTAGDQTPRITSLALLAALSSSSFASPALAASTQDITDAVVKVQDVAEKLKTSAENAYETSKSFLDQLFTAVKPAVDAATPYVQKATDAAVQVAAPIASDVASQADKVLKNAGVDTKPVLEAAKTAAVVAGEAAEQTAKVIQGAKPVASSTLESVFSADPLYIAGGAGAVVLLYFLTPSLLSSLAYAARGYKGDLSAPQVLDLLSSSNYLLVDVRSEKERSKSGLPSLPRNAKNKLLTVSLEELPGKLRAQVRNPRKLEAEIAALKISFLKRIGKGSNIVLLDSYGDIAKTVAKSLSVLGFKSAYVVSGGFDGGKGWVQSRLGTENYNSSYAEILSPSRIIPAGTRKLFKTTSSEVVDVTPRFSRLLPGGSDE